MTDKLGLHARINPATDLKAGPTAARFMGLEIDVVQSESVPVNIVMIVKNDNSEVSIVDIKTGGIVHLDSRTIGEAWAATLRRNTPEVIK